MAVSRCEPKVTECQNISKASTGLRTIAARIRKTVSEEDGDEMINEAKYEEMVNALTKRHVKLVDDLTGEYRSTYDVLRDIAAVWDDMNSMEQAATIEALAGTRQQNIFSSIITQFREAEDAIKAMDNSAGALSESYGIYMDSIQARTNIMKAAFEELSMNFVNSDFAKESIDFLTTLLELLNGLLDPLGKLLGFIGPIGTLAGAGGLFALFKNLGRPHEGTLISEIFKLAYHGQEHAETAA